MKLIHLKWVFCAIGLIGILLISGPLFSAILEHTSREIQFSELYLLGPEHTILDYPLTVTVGDDYSLFIGITNHLQSTGYYVLYAKVRNYSDALPNVQTGVPSSQQPLYEFRFVINDGETRELPFNFSVKEVSFSEPAIKSIVINGLSVQLDKPVSTDSTKHGLSCELYFELWLFNGSSNALEFNSRYVGLYMNIA
ncbi:MAG: DUF1616 domain-containing protein [Candidatus Bathyarchaeota archaeon]|nr:DUF1616 domain-containing protein [Candidatus Bathyarchaeota archaeon]